MLKGRLVRILAIEVYLCLLYYPAGEIFKGNGKFIFKVLSTKCVPFDKKFLLKASDDDLLGCLRFNRSSKSSISSPELCCGLAAASKGIKVVWITRADSWALPKVL